ncbi:hypothetical protein B0H11DRAFT_2235609 [Mycena galericulata]|nr:hypothetical protein B0H11DRAFT_2235609 [Mycena galericulata]
MYAALAMIIVRFRSSVSGGRLLTVASLPKAIIGGVSSDGPTPPSSLGRPVVAVLSVCYSDCEVATPSSAAVPSASGSSCHHAPAVRQREFQAAMDSDEEEEFMQEALKRSMVDAPNAAGPSRPLPRPPPGVRSRSSEPTAFRSIRRRLNNNSPAIDLTRSPSPEIRHPTFRSVAGWAQSLEAVLSATASRIHGPTTTLLVEGLLAHITSFFGGEPYRARNAEDTSTELPSRNID